MFSIPIYQTVDTDFKGQIHQKRLIWLELKISELMKIILNQISKIPSILKYFIRFEYSDTEAMICFVSLFEVWKKSFDFSALIFFDSLGLYSIVNVWPFVPTTSVYMPVIIWWKYMDHNKLLCKCYGTTHSIARYVPLSSGLFYEINWEIERQFKIRENNFEDNISGNLIKLISSTE